MLTFLLLGQCGCSVSEEAAAALTLGLIPPAKLQSADQYIGMGTLGVEFQDAKGAWLQLKFEDVNDWIPEEDRGALFLTRGSIKNPKARRKLREGCREARAAASLVRTQLNSWYSRSELKTVRTERIPPYRQRDAKLVAAWYGERIARKLENYGHDSKSVASPRITRALEKSTRVQSFYLNPFMDNRAFEAGDEFTIVLGWVGDHRWLGKYGILGKGADLNPDQLRQIGDLLLPYSNYRIHSGPDDDKLCEFMPRHGLRFTTADDDTVDALVCFGCSQLSLITMDGSERWGGGFDPMEKELKRLFEEFLPARGQAAQ